MTPTDRLRDALKRYMKATKELLPHYGSDFALPVLIAEEYDQAELAAKEALAAAEAPPSQIEVTEAVIAWWKDQWQCADPEALNEHRAYNGMPLIPDSEMTLMRLAQAALRLKPKGTK